MDTDWGAMLNLALFIKGELQAQMIPHQQLYRTGNMRSSVEVVEIDNRYVDIVIATEYASFTNTRGRTAGWIEKTLDRACRCYSENVSNELTEGIEFEVNYGI